MRSARLLIASLLLIAGLAAHAENGNPRVRVETNMGKFVIELDPARAPLTVANFLEYVRSGAAWTGADAQLNNKGAGVARLIVASSEYQFN